LVRITLGLAVAGVVLYLGALGLLLLLERPLLFPRPRVSRAELATLAARLGATELVITAEDDTALYGWRLPATPVEPRDDASILVVLFSGNGSTVGGPQTHYALLQRAGAEVLHVNYRGYPGSAGLPDEAGLLLDARAAWAEARRTHPADRIALLGKSLGGGVAIALAAALDETPRALIVESTFTAIHRLAREQYPFVPARQVMRSPFDSLARAPRIRCPTLVLHGEADELIDVAHGRELAAAIPGAVLLTVPGLGHNDVVLAAPRAAAAAAPLLMPGG